MRHFAMVRLMSRRILAAFNTWRNNVEEAKEARAEAARQAARTASDRVESEAAAAALRARLDAPRRQGAERVLRRVMVGRCRLTLSNQHRKPLELSA